MEIKPIGTFTYTYMLLYSAVQYSAVVKYNNKVTCV
jgi:hypothetical protein